MNKKVMVVDNDPVFLEAADGFLTGKGYEVLKAENGKDALGLAVKELPDIIILDVVMPGMSGFEVCREIKKKKKTKDIPVIIVSGKINEIERGFDFGADDCVLKPLDWGKLSEKMEAILV